MLSDAFYCKYIDDIISDMSFRIKNVFSKTAFFAYIIILYL